MPNNLINKNGLVLLGCGKMGSALLKGWLADGINAKSINIIEPNPTKWLKKIPEINFQLWKSYKEFHTYLSESEENLVFCKIGKQIICIKNNGKIFKFEIGKVLLQDIM